MRMLLTVIALVVVAFAVATAFGVRRQQRDLATQIELLERVAGREVSEAVVDPTDEMPPPVARYLRWSLSRTRSIRAVRLKQVGTLRTDVGSNRWMASFAQRREELAASAVATATIEASRTLAVTATYLLSEEGRKASLLAGGDGRAVQELTLQVPTNRLHLVSVDAEGVARLKLRPRYELNDEQRVVRIDAPPTYDSPPEIEGLFREAARNHQLERTYETERRSAKAKRRDADRERREQLANAFLADPTQRALVHPAPTPKRCWLAAPNGRVVFDLNTDDGVARDVPPEAHRRFRADLRARREQNLKTRAEQLALHQEKKRFIAEWIATNGTPEQQSRQAAGVLPINEAIEAMTDHAFAALANRPRYMHDGLGRLEAHLRQYRQYADAIVARDDLVVTSANAGQATASQWALVKEFEALLPEATIVLRVHKLTWKQDLQAPALTIVGMLVTQKLGPFTLRREYAQLES